MFSALKKFVSADNQDGSKIDVPDGMHTMGQSLQRKFAKGVQYNSEYSNIDWYQPNMIVAYIQDSIILGTLIVTGTVLTAKYNCGIHLQ